MKRERSHSKLKRVFKAKGYKKGELPKNKVAHHVKPIAEGGKTTKRNVKVVTKAKHRRIHKNRRKIGKI